MKKTTEEIIERVWRIVYSNSNEYPFTDSAVFEKVLNVQEKNCMWSAVHLFWRFYWVTDIQFLDTN